MKLNGVLSFIFNKWEIRVNDKVLLNKISNFFGVEFAVLYIVNFESILDENNTEFDYYASKNIIEKYKNVTDMHFSGAFKESFLNKTILNIGDYDKYKNAVKECKNANLKSILSAPIVRKNEAYGCLQIACFDKKNRFNSKDEFYLKIIADAMAPVVSDEIHRSKVKLHNSAENLHIKISSSLKNISKISIWEWLKNNMRHVLRYSNAYISGFIMPSDNIYCIVDVEDKFTVCQEQLNNRFDRWITATLFKKNVKNPITLDEAMRIYGVDLSRRVNVLGLKDGIYVPIEYNGKAVAFFSYGFKKKIKNIHYHKILLKNIGIHIFMSILTFRRLSNIERVITKSEEQFIKSLMKIAEVRDTYTKGHSERVAYYAKIIGESLGLPDEKKNIVYTAGLLHDIGKIGIPDSVLLKPGKLSNHEYEIIKYHSIFSYEMVKDIAPLSKVSRCIRHHHERCDGYGYPDGIKCEEIECCAKILAIADVFDALTSSRTYREKSRYSPEEAIEIMKNMSLDKEIFNLSKDALVNYYQQELNHGNILQLENIENERRKIFFKDYLTGTDRVGVFRDFVNSTISKNNSFCLFLLDIKNMSYINYKYGIDYGNKLLEYIANELLQNVYIQRVMRDGADSFVFMSSKESIKNIASFIDELDSRVKLKFFPNSGKYKNSILYKTFVIFPKEGATFEDLLYKLRTKIKNIRGDVYNNTILH